MRAIHVGAHGHAGTVGTHGHRPAEVVASIAVRPHELQQLIRRSLVARRVLHDVVLVSPVEVGAEVMPPVGLPDPAMLGDVVLVSLVEAGVEVLPSVVLPVVVLSPTRRSPSSRESGPRSCRLS